MNDILKHWELAGCSRHKLAQRAADLEVPVLKAVELRVRYIDRELQSMSRQIADADMVGDGFDFTFSYLYPDMLALLKERERLLDRPKPDADIAFERAVEKAREYPISEMIEFGRNHKGLCPFHSDTQPSLHYYPQNNSVWCYSCSKYADSIEVYMKMNGVNFRQAVKEMAR